MLLHQTSLGELYLGLKPKERKDLSHHLERNAPVAVLALYRALEAMLQRPDALRIDTEQLRGQLSEHPSKPIHTSTFTTHCHLLSQHIKEFLILSKIKEKNIYTETLWGEILIERNLTKVLRIKLSNFKYNLFKDSYSLLKLFLHKRENSLYSFLTTKKNYSQLAKFQVDQLDAFNEYIHYYKLELLISLNSIYSKSIEQSEKLKEQINETLGSGLLSNNYLIRIQSLVLSISFDKNETSFFELKNIFISKFDELARETILQIFPTLLNFGHYQIARGKEIYDKENYAILKLIDKKNLLLSSGFFSVTRAFTYLRSEIKYGNLQSTNEILDAILANIPISQRPSFENLIRSRIAYAEENYKEALRHILSINPSDSIYYFPQYKIMLIKCHIELNDVERLAAESENFYRYLLHNKKRIPDDAQRRHKLFIQYAEYMTEARYPYLSDYMLRRVENALHIDAPYFTEKEALRERWGWLKKKFGHDTGATISE